MAGHISTPTVSRVTMRGSWTWENGSFARCERPRGFVAGAGIAEGKFVAWAAAVTSEPGQVCTVPAGKEGEFLQPLDVSLFQIHFAVSQVRDNAKKTLNSIGQSKAPVASADTLRRLDLYGLRTIGELASLPPGPLQAQFGGEGMRLWELARGIDSEPLRPRRREEAMSETLRFPTAAVSVEALVVACRRLLVRLHWRLHGRAARRLRLRAALWGGRSWEKTLTFHEAVTDWERMLFIVKSVPRRRRTAGAGRRADNRADRDNGGARPPVDAVRGEGGAQAAAWRDGAPATHALGTASRIAGGGGGAVVATAGEASRPYRLRTVTGLSPLKEPRPLVVATGESGEPVAVVLGGRRLAVERVEDVWRIDDEWWREEVSRLYYRLLLEDGRPLVVFHDLVRELWCEQTY